MKKILINGLQLGDKNTGVQYYTKNLAQEIKKATCKKFEFDLLRSSTLTSPVLLSIFFLRNESRIKRIFLENFSLPSYLRKRNYLLYHSPNYVLPYFFNFPSVLTVHDLITLDYPELCQNGSVLYFKLLLSRSIRRATRVIAVSRTVKDDILRHFDISEEKIEVVYHGISPIFKSTSDKSIGEKYRLPEKYIVFVGNIEPKKNLERLVRAFDVLRKTTDIKHKLVVVGKKGWKYNTVFETITKLKIDREVMFTGYVPEEDLPAIYSMAELFVFPSLYEGFGIPPLEAMACEVPVMVSNKGALPEITGGKCLQVDPYNVREIAKGMHRLLTDDSLRKKTIREGKEWIKQFSWERAAKETLRIYGDILRF